MRIGDKEHTTADCSCPNCNHAFRAATGIDHDEPPRPGDYAICVECGKVLVYKSDLSVAPIPIKDLSESDQQTVRRIQATIRRMHAQEQADE